MCGQSTRTLVNDRFPCSHPVAGKKDPALCGDSDGEELLVTINAEPMSEEEVEYWRRLSETPNIHTSMPEEVKKRGTGSVIVEGHEKHNFFGRGPEWGKSKVYTTAVTASVCLLCIPHFPRGGCLEWHLSVSMHVCARLCACVSRLLSFVL